MIYSKPNHDKVREPKPTEYYFFNTRKNSIHYNLEWTG